MLVVTEITKLQKLSLHSRPQRPRSFWSALRISTSGQVQRHSGFEWLCKHSRLRPEPIRFVRLDSEHAQSDGKSVNRGLPALDLARGRDSWCWPKGVRSLGTRMLLLENRETLVCTCVEAYFKVIPSICMVQPYRASFLLIIFSAPSCTRILKTWRIALILSSVSWKMAVAHQRAWAPHFFPVIVIHSS